MSTVNRLMPRGRRRGEDSGLLLLVPILLLTLWYLTTRNAAFGVPTPTGVVEAAQGLVEDGRLLAGLSTSLLRVLQGFAIALVVGSFTGIAMGRIRAVRWIVDPLVETLRPIAPIALVPLAILWLGTGTASSTAIVTYAAFFPITLNVYAAARDVDSSLVNAAYTFGVKPWVVLTQVVLPSVLPGVAVGARLGMGLAWTSVIAAELAVGVSSEGSPGVGQLMMIFYQFEVDPNPIVVCMIAVGVVGLTLDLLLRRLSQRVMPWNT